MKLLMPQNVKKIKKYRGKIPLFHEAGIEKSLNRIFESSVKLTSGGYLVINPTEALVSIDINSGQSIKEINKTIFTKSGIMLGLGETRDEVLQVMVKYIRISINNHFKRFSFS